MGVPLRCPPRASSLQAASLLGDHVVSIPSSQWLHNSCHTNLCARILPTFGILLVLQTTGHDRQWSLWSCRPPCIDPAIFLWSLQSYMAPCMDAVGLPWLIRSCMDPGVFPRLPPCPDCHACTPPISCGFSGPTDHCAWTLLPSCGLSSPTTQPIWTLSVPGAPPAPRVRPAVCDPGLHHPSQSHLKHP